MCDTRMGMNAGQTETTAFIPYPGLQGRACRFHSVVCVYVCACARARVLGQVGKKMEEPEDGRF